MVTPAFNLLQIHEWIIYWIPECSNVLQSSLQRQNIVKQLKDFEASAAKEAA